MAISIGDVYRASCLGDWNATYQGIMTLHFKCIGTGAELATLGGQIRTTLLYPLTSYQDDTWYWRQINFLSENLTPPLGANFSTGFPNQGSIVGDSLPYMSAVVVKLATGYAGRSYRGRNYIPALSESLAADTIVASGTVAAIQAVYDDLVDLFGVGGSDDKWQLGIWSSVAGRGFTAVNQAVVRNILGTQRRRRPGVGS